MKDIRKYKFVLSNKNLWNHVNLYNYLCTRRIHTISHDFKDNVVAPFVIRSLMQVPIYCRLRQFTFESVIPPNF